MTLFVSWERFLKVLHEFFIFSSGQNWLFFNVLLYHRNSLPVKVKYLLHCIQSLQIHSSRATAKLIFKFECPNDCEIR